MSRICNQFYQQKNSTCRQISHKVNRHLSQITVHDEVFLYFGQKKNKKNAELAKRQAMIAKLEAENLLT